MKKNYPVLGILMMMLFALPIVSAAPPVLTNLTVYDTDQDGDFDTLIANFSEILDGNVSGLGFSVVGNGCVLSSANQSLPGVMNFTIGCNSGTGSPPTLEYSASTGDLFTSGGSSPADDLANFGPNASRDGASPVVLARLTKDTDSNGKLDRITIWFSESLNTTSGTSGVNVTVAGYNVTAYNLSGAYLNVTISENSSYDTGVTPNVFLENAGNLTDATGNAVIVDTSGVASADAATPILHTVRISSNNTNTSYARLGQNISLFINASENIFSVAINISTRVANISGSGSTRYANLTPSSSDPEGRINFTITFEDASTYIVNVGTLVNSTTDGSYVILDRTAPTVSDIYINDSQKIVVVFSENVTGVNVSGANFINLTGGYFTSCSPSAVNGSGQIYVVTLSSCSSTTWDTNATGNLTLTSLLIQDHAGNAYVSANLSVEDGQRPTQANLTAGTLTSSSAVLTMTTSEIASCSWSNSNISYSSMTNVFSTTSALSHSTTVSNLDASTEYTLYVLCQDSANNTALVSSSVTFTTSARSSSSSGGGGGGGGSSRTVTVAPPAVARAASVLAKTPAPIKFVQKDLPIRSAEMTFNKDKQNVGLSVRNLNLVNPTGKSLPGKLYTVLEINRSNFQADELETATLRFEVTKKWLSDNGLTADQIALFRYSNEQWTSLNTRLVSDTDVVIYEADTTGFSYFAIAQKEVKQETAPVQNTNTEQNTAPQQNTEPVPVVEETAAQAPTESEPQTQTEEEKPKSSKLVWLLLFVGVVAAITLFMVFGKPKKEGSIQQERQSGSESEKQFDSSADNFREHHGGHRRR